MQDLEKLVIIIQKTWSWKRKAPFCIWPNPKITLVTTHLRRLHFVTIFIDCGFWTSTKFVLWYSSIVGLLKGSTFSIVKYWDKYCTMSCKNNRECFFYYSLCLYVYSRDFLQGRTEQGKKFELPKANLVRYIILFLSWIFRITSIPIVLPLFSLCS